MVLALQSNHKTTFLSKIMTMRTLLIASALFVMALLMTHSSSHVFTAQFSGSCAATSQKVKSPTLGFDKIYVMSLRDRTDRRLKMRQLADALGLDFTFFDAKTKDNSAVVKIHEEARKLANVAPEDVCHGIDYGSKQELGQLAEKFNIDTESCDPGIGGTDLWWTLATKDKSLVTPNVKLSAQPHKKGHPKIPIGIGHIASAYSIYSILQQVVRQGLQSVLLLEDDIDFEHDIERYLDQVRPSLPPTWDVL